MCAGLWPRYHSFEQAEQDGYAIRVGEPCVASPLGTMGVHALNAALMADDAIDPVRPEILLYVPDEQGSLKLVGVEYWKADADQNPRRRTIAPRSSDSHSKARCPAITRRCRSLRSRTRGLRRRTRAARSPCSTPPFPVRNESRRSDRAGSLTPCTVRALGGEREHNDRRQGSRSQCSKTPSRRSTSRGVAPSASVATGRGTTSSWSDSASAAGSARHDRRLPDPAPGRRTLRFAALLNGAPHPRFACRMSAEGHCRYYVDMRPQQQAPHRQGVAMRRRGDDRSRATPLGLPCGYEPEGASRGDTRPGACDRCFDLASVEQIEFVGSGALFSWPAASRSGSSTRPSTAIPPVTSTRTVYEPTVG